MCPNSNTVAGMEDDLQWGTDNEAKADSPDSGWNPYDDRAKNETQDVCDELCVPDNEASDFERF